MKITRFLCMMMIFICIFIVYNSVFAAEYDKTNSEDKTKAIEKAFSEWIDSFKSETTPENQRITDYQLGVTTMRNVNENEIKASVEFVVTPVSKENTIWNYGEPETDMINGQEYVVFQASNICYIQMKNVNGEYQVEYIGETPEGYDEFSKRFEEYKKTHPQEEVENTQIQGKETDNQLANQKIEKMRNGIVIGCSIILVVMVSLMIMKIVKYKSKR